MANGKILYQGPSQLDGAPIVVIATGLNKASSNAKTGGMVQTYILRSDISPVEASNVGADQSVCGNCPMRVKQGKSSACYVLLFQGPTSVYKAFKAGSYPTLDTNQRRPMEGMKVRLGTYGDPASVPLWVWAWILEGTESHTGYTHQWRQERFLPLMSVVMASCDTPKDQEQATEMGWRTFRTRLPHEPLHKGEISCPASNEAGKRTECAKCGLCNGAGVWDDRKSIAIIAHGPANKVNAYRQARLAIV